MRTGWIIRLAVQAAVPALAKLCAKGIAKGGKSVFKFRGKNYDVKLDKPLQPKNDRKPSEKPEKRPSRTQDCKNPGNKRFAKRAHKPKNIHKDGHASGFRSCHDPNLRLQCSPTGVLALQLRHEPGEVTD